MHVLSQSIALYRCSRGQLEQKAILDMKYLCAPLGDCIGQHSEHHRAGGYVLSACEILPCGDVRISETVVSGEEIDS